MPNTEPIAGQLRRKRLLGSEATYRVVAVEGEHVTVEVVAAPGLAAGRWLRLTRDAVRGLDVVEAPRHSRTGGRVRPSETPHAAA